MAVINPPDHHVDDLDHYFEAQSEIIKVEFIQKFVEFGKARFYLDIIETT